MLRIGYDSRAVFSNFAGPGSYSRTLLHNLAEYFPDNAYFLFTNQLLKSPETSFFLSSALYNVQTPRHRAFQSLWPVFGVRRELRKKKVQLYHGLNQEIPYALHKEGVRTVATVHDLAFRRFPEQYSLKQRLLLNLKLEYICRHADHIIATSNSTKEELLYFYKVEEERVAVIYQSCHERFMQETSQKTREGVRSRYNLPDEYLLSVGALTPRKNLLGAIRAIALLPSSDRLPIVVVGKGGGYKKYIQEEAKQLGIDRLIRFAEVRFDDLPAVYQGASMLLYPSFYEGFGIPILEAQFSQVPVLTSNTASLPEAGGPGALLTDPNSPEAIRDGIAKILGDEAYRLQLVQAGFEHAQQFLGGPLSRQMMSLYENLIGQEYLSPEPIT